MDNVNLERVPLPRFSTYLIYTAVSLLGSTARIIYVLSPRFLVSNKQPYWNNATNADLPVIHICVDDTWFFWSVINFAYCLLIFFGRKLQRFFFGELRAEENTHIRDNLSNFIFYKVVFVYGILNVEALHELLMWAAWFSVLGFLHLLAGLAKDRFEFIMQSLEAPLFHAPLLSLLCTLLFLGNLLMGVSVAIGTRYSIHIMFFMLAEVFQLAARTIHVIVWYAVQLYSEVAQMTDANSVYHKSTSLYYVELFFSSITDLGDLVHNIHLAFWNRLRVNMSSIIVGMHLQHLYYKLSKRYRHHMRYRKVVNFLESTLTRRQLPDENCVVCWESLDEAGELPCGHTFHTACLRKWLERSAHCPTCRTRLISLDTEATPSLESEQWGSVGAPEASHLMQQSTQPLSEFAHASSELQQTRKQNEHIDALKTESVIENYGSCSSCSEYAGPSGYGSTSKTMSAMVCIHRLLDVSNDSRNEGANGAEMNVQPCSPLLPDKFVEALEAELIHYFQRKVSPTDSDTHCSVSQRDASMCRKHTVRATATGGHSYDPSSSTTTRASHREFSEAIGIPQSDSVTIEQVEFPPKRVLRMAIRHLIHRVTQAGAAARVVGAHVASLTSSSSDEESIESYNPRGLSHQPIHLRRGGNSVPEVTSSLRESSDHMRDTGATVFHSTHALRERSLERRKVAIRNRARLNFLRNQKVVAVE